MVVWLDLLHCVANLGKQLGQVVLVVLVVLQVQLVLLVLDFRLVLVVQHLL